MADEHSLPLFDFDTRAVRAGTLRSQFNEHSEGLFLTSSFIFDSAAQAAERFSGAEEGYVYSRFPRSVRIPMTSIGSSFRSNESKARPVFNGDSSKPRRGAGR